MFEEINFQNFGVTGRTEHLLDLFKQKDSDQPITGIILGEIDGEQIIMKKIIFAPIFNVNDDQIEFNRDDTTTLLEHYKSIFNLQVVGWFINRELGGLVPTMHFILNEFKGSLFVLVTGKLDLNEKDLQLTVYSPLVNKNFNTCFGSFGINSLKIQNTYKNINFKNFYEQNNVSNDNLDLVMQNLLTDENFQKLSQNSEIFQKLKWLAYNKNRFTQQQMQLGNEEFERHQKNQIELLQALKQEVERTRNLTLSTR